MEEKRNWWEEGLRMKGANFGEVVEEKNSIQNEWLMVFLVLFFFLLFFQGMFSSILYKLTKT